MDQFDQTLQELKDTQDFIRGRLVDREAFNKFVQALATVWHKLRNTFEQRLQDITIKVDREMAQNKVILDSGVKRMDSGISTISKEQDKLKSDVTGELKLLRKYIEDVEYSIPEEFDSRELELQIENTKKSIDQISTKREVWERFDKIEKKLRAIENDRPSVVQRVFGGGRPVHVPMVDDWSTLTDGSKKTFYLSKQPRSLTTTKIWGSDFPYIMRVNVDFTVTGKLVTLTSEVDAPSAGSTLVCEYYS